jgi:hypothetical protein
MSNHISFNFSNESASSGEPQFSQPMLCVHPFEVMPLNEKTSLLISKYTGRSFPVAVHLLELLQGMNSFRTLPNHLERMPERVKNTVSLQALEELAKALLRSGIATSSEDFLRGFNRAVKSSRPKPAASRIFLVTCDREQELERLLASIFSNADLSLHQAIYLLDDSRDARTAERNRALLAKYQDNSSIPLQYYGKEEKEDFMSRLIAKEPEVESAIRLLLDRSYWQGHKTYGLSRNWALMLSAGHRCIMLDDDVLCEAFFPPYADKHIRFGNTINVQVLASEQEWRNQVAPAGFDPLQGHLQLLGQDVQTCLEKHNLSALTNCELEGMNGSQLESLSPDSPILISECGTYGDPGFPSHAFLLKSSRKDIERTLATDPNLSLTFGQRQFQAVQKSLSIYDSAGLSQMTGVDNSRLMPPYFPAFRGEDGLFGWLVKQMYPESRTIIYNWGIPHQPMDNRVSDYRKEAIIPKMNLGAFEGLSTDRTSLIGRSTPIGRLRLIAAMIRDLSEKPQKELIALASIETTRQSASVYAGASARLPYFSGHLPEYVAYLQFAIKEASESLQSPSRLAAYFDMSEDCDDKVVVSRMATAASEFADALEAWPRIWDVARQLN